MLISKFKARCIGEIKQVHRTGRSLTITLRGKPIAMVVPVGQPGEDGVKLGTRPGNAVIHGDLVAASFEDEWEMNR